jgi:hypothetical protein
MSALLASIHAFLRVSASKALDGRDKPSHDSGDRNPLKSSLARRETNMMLTLAERNVPRYTSYPTAPHFSAAVGPREYAQWLAELPDAATLSLYLHVPYCKELCLYCGCTTKAVRRRGPIEAYAEYLKKEIDLLGAVIGGRRVVHLHWGGGRASARRTFHRTCNRRSAGSSRSSLWSRRLRRCVPRASRTSIST